MSAAPDDLTEPERLISIGAVARRLSVSTRTLRYYQELGLIDPAGVSPGGNRRYSTDDVARFERILELRNVMGFDLDRIREILGAEDRLNLLRLEVRSGVTKARRIEMLQEAAQINAQLQDQVAQKAAVLAEFAEELRATRHRYVAIGKELGVSLPD